MRWCQWCNFAFILNADDPSSDPHDHLMILYVVGLALMVATGEQERG